MRTRGELSGTRALVQLYTPPAAQGIFGLLCQIEAAISESLRAGIDHQVAHTRLAWWGEECTRLGRSEPAHPLTRALAAAFTAQTLPPPATLSGFVDTASWDLASATFATRRELTAYCTRWAAAMLTPLFTLAGVPGGSPAAAPAASLGAALREIELLGTLGTDARLGRLRVPLDELARAQVEPVQLTARPWPRSLAALVAQRHQSLRQELRGQVQALPGALQPALRGVLVWAQLAAEVSRRAERVLPQPPGPREDYRPLDAWRAWRAARRADAARFALA
jgi:15-cis-phytoene synthase